MGTHVSNCVRGGLGGGGVVNLVIVGWQVLAVGRSLLGGCRRKA